MLQRTQRTPSIFSETARYPFLVRLHRVIRKLADCFQITRHQGGIEALFHGSMGAKGLHVQRSTIPTAIQLSSDPSALKDPKANPVKVSLLLSSSFE